jgi:hypothetical protein
MSYLKKVNWGIIFLILLFIFYFYKISKYGLIGYLQRRSDNKKERRKKVFNSLFY